MWTLIVTLRRTRASVDHIATYVSTSLLLACLPETTSSIQSHFLIK